LSIQSNTRRFSAIGYPEIVGLEVRWYKAADDVTRGLVAVSVPAQADNSRPFLVAHTVVDTDKRRDIVFGYGEREGAVVSSLRIADLYALLRDGRRYDQLLRQRFDEVMEEQRSVRRLLEANAREETPPSISEDERRARLRNARKSSDLG